MIEMRRQGLTFRMIGDAFGVTSERARQIIKNGGGPTIKELQTIRRAKARAALEQYRADIAARLRPLLMQNGPMFVPEVAARLNITEKELSKNWPADLAKYRMVYQYRDIYWTKELIITALRDAAKILDEAGAKKKLTTETYRELVSTGQVNGPSTAIVMHKFSGWLAACEVAGVRQGKRYRNYTTRWTDSELVDIVAQFFQNTDLKHTYDLFERWLQAQGSGAPSISTVRNRLGDWTVMKRLALSPQRGLAQELAEN